MKEPKALSFYLNNEKSVRITWHDVDQDVLRIVRKLKKDKFEPDVIVSMARSGLIPAALISYCIGNKQLYTIKADFSRVQSNDKKQDLLPRPILTQRIKKSLKGLKLLVVDEMTVSGETLKLVAQYLKTKKPKVVKFAVLYRQPWSTFKPDYFGREIRAWPLYPWKELHNHLKDPRAK